jgi:hypothetical protein
MDKASMINKAKKFGHISLITAVFAALISTNYMFRSSLGLHDSAFNEAMAAGSDLTFLFSLFMGLFATKAFGKSLGADDKRGLLWWSSLPLSIAVVALPLSFIGSLVFFLFASIWCDSNEICQQVWAIAFMFYSFLLLLEIAAAIAFVLLIKMTPSLRVESKTNPATSSVVSLFTILFCSILFITLALAR